MSKKYQLAIKNAQIYGESELSLTAVGLLVHLVFEDKRNPQKITTVEQILKTRPNNNQSEVSAALEELEIAGYIKDVG